MTVKIDDGTRFRFAALYLLLEMREGKKFSVLQQGDEEVLSPVFEWLVEQAYLDGRYAVQS